LSRGIRRIVIAGKLITAGEETVIATGTFIDVNHQSISGHFSLSLPLTNLYQAGVVGLPRRILRDHARWGEQVNAPTFINASGFTWF
jgi:hypothetical protein